MLAIAIMGMWEEKHLYDKLLVSAGNTDLTDPKLGSPISNGVG